ncbi:MAG: DMT family transporter [Bacteroidota bacterium]
MIAKKNYPMVYVLIVLSMLIWGISYISLKLVYDYFTPVTTVVLRIMIASIFMLLLSLILKRLQKIHLKDFKIFLLFALIDPCLYFMFESYGLKLSSPTTAAVIIAMIPLITPFAAAFFIKEKITILNTIGIIISFTGVLFVIITNDFSLAVEPLGLAFLFGAVFCAVFYNFFLKNLAAKYNVFTIITVQNLISSVYLIPLLLIYGLEEIRAVNFDSKLIINFLGLSIFASAVAFIFYAKAIKEIGITKANVFTNTIPVFTAFFSYMIIKEDMSLQKVIGILLVITGVILSQRKKFNSQ